MVKFGEFFKNAFAAAREADNYLAMVFWRGIAPDKIIRDKAIEQADGAVMAKLEALGEFTDSDMIPSGKTFNREQCLVVLRCYTCGARGAFAEVQETA